MARQIYTVHLNTANFDRGIKISIVTIFWFMAKTYDKKYDLLLDRLSQNLKRIRLEKGLTQEAMRDRGLDYRHYQRLESGTYSPTLQTLHKVAMALKVDVSELLSIQST